MKRIFAIALILGCTAAGWFVLAGVLSWRSESADQRLSREVTGNWGAPMVQAPPTLFYMAPTAARTRRPIQPEQSQVQVRVQYEPKKKGLLWYRTYLVDFQADYLIRNPTPITQTVYVEFEFPTAGIRYDRFKLSLGDKQTDKAPVEGRIIESILLEPGVDLPVQVSYWAAGLDRWDYSLGANGRVRNFVLQMETDFSEINIPDGAESPTSRETTANGWRMVWDYSDVIGARAIGMDMPAVVNPGPVAARIAYFAPVSLLFYFAVMVILGIVRRVNLHPMHFFFLAAGCFAFQLLFAYLVDLIPITPAFAIAAAVSLVLVTGYLWLVAGKALARLSAAAQLGYMVLFSYSFFFNGLTGITITIGAVLTLALLMAFTAKLDWDAVFRGRG